MNIFIIANNDTDSPQMMAPSLSQFFEMHLGWASESEAKQIEKLLSFDLSPFMTFVEKENIDDAVWQDMNGLLHTLQQLISKLKANPYVHTQIQYSAAPQTHLQEQLLKLTLEGDKEKIKQMVKEWQHTPDSKYPPEIGYVRRGFLLEDLIGLEKMLRGMMKEGAEKIQLHYY